MSDSISRADAIKAVEDLPNAYNGWSDTYDKACIIGVIEELPSADAEPKWNCTANFVAEQLDRLRKMTDEEKWNFFREFFGMGDAVHGEWIIRENGNKECSLCGHERQDGWDYFCGYCGTRMKGRQNADKTQTMNDQHTVDHDRDWIIGCIEHDGFIHTHRFDKANQIIHDALSAGAGWIPCSERLPEKGEVVLITNGKGNVRCGQYRSEHDVRDGAHYWWWKGKTVETVLAWMPLPMPYREDGE